MHFPQRCSSLIQSTSVEILILLVQNVVNSCYDVIIKINVEPKCRPMVIILWKGRERNLRSPRPDEVSREDGKLGSWKPHVLAEYSHSNLGRVGWCIVLQKQSALRQLPTVPGRQFILELFQLFSMPDTAHRLSCQAPKKSRPA
eukprot:scpid83853/ scgid27464/ 